MNDKTHLKINEYERQTVERLRKAIDDTDMELLEAKMEAYRNSPETKLKLKRERLDIRRQKLRTAFLYVKTHILEFILIVIGIATLIATIIK